MSEGKFCSFCAFITYGFFSGLFYYYTFIIEKDNVCTASDESQIASNTDGAYDVSERFHTVLMLFTFTIFVGYIRAILSVVEILALSKGLFWQLPQK
ncbi:UNKNOWN [Stylonychia lemnae]|uniref:Uncharacterized protein n=1 Tax=Stylonychia lemnae TaxID=5949 RepID=A0A078ATY1_STYLE|nr:UNKNOWN [Stylonychia lemnae]|eukprot:CDW84303.1 UNKNOWN [Stylonychia lemnae]